MASANKPQTISSLTENISKKLAQGKIYDELYADSDSALTKHIVSLLSAVDKVGCIDNHTRLQQDMKTKKYSPIIPLIVSMRSHL